MVEEIFRQFKAKNRGCNVTWFAAQLNCDRRNIYDIFQRPTIDTQLLARICLVLNHNFFQDLSDLIENKMRNLKPDFKSDFSFVICFPLDKFFLSENFPLMALFSLNN